MCYWCFNAHAEGYKRFSLFPTIHSVVMHMPLENNIFEHWQNEKPPSLWYPIRMSPHLFHFHCRKFYFVVGLLFKALSLFGTRCTNKFYAYYFLHVINPPCDKWTNQTVHSFNQRQSKSVLKWIESSRWWWWRPRLSGWDKDDSDDTLHPPDQDIALNPEYIRRLHISMQFIKLKVVL